MPTTTKSAVILRDFNDAGTGASYTKDETVAIEAGSFENYRVAGLVRAADADAEEAPAT